MNIVSVNNSTNIYFYTNRLSIKSQLKIWAIKLTFLAGFAQARASMEPSDAWPEMDRSRTGEFGQVKFQISMEVSARESASRFL